MSNNEETAKKDSNVTNISEILDRFEAKRSNRKARGAKKKSKNRATQERKFYNEEDDDLWAEYFHGKEPKEETKLKTERVPQKESDTATDTVIDTEEYKTKPKPKPKKTSYKKKENLPTLDSTHTASEAKVYSIMYRETISKDVDQGYFSVRGLMEDTGIGSPNTVRKALKGLRAKKSIELVGELNTNPLGTRYRVNHPRDIFKLRDNKEIKIDSRTKKIISSQGRIVDDTVSTTVSEGVSATESNSVSEGVSNIDTATVSKTDTAKESTLYINNRIIDDDSFEESSSSNINRSKNDDDIDDDQVFDHKKYVIYLYQKYSDNSWVEKTDGDFYKVVKSVYPDIVEAAIITTYLRAEDSIKSFSDCEGCIREFQQNFPPGYLGYLRNKWKEARQTGSKSKKLILPENSYFQEEWLGNYISDFPKDEHARIKRLAEQFDHFMLTSGEEKEWIKNPTGAFIGLVRGEINVRLSKDAPTFEERIGEEREIGREELERKEAEGRRESMRIELKAAMTKLEADKRENFIANASSRYDINRTVGDQALLESAMYQIINEVIKAGKEDWRDIWEEIKEGR